MTKYLVQLKVYTDSLNQIINDVVKKETWKSENERYLDVCAHYANIMATLSEHYSHLTLFEITPITLVFKEYRDNYFNGDA